MKDEQGFEVEETPAQAGEEGGKEAETPAAAEGATAEGKPQEAQPEAKPVPKYTDADMAEARRKYQGETRKERDARIAAETEARILREQQQAGGKTVHKDTAEQDAEPNPDNFETVAEYARAVSDFAARKAVRDYEASTSKRQQELTAKQQQEQAQKIRDEFISRGAKEYGEDFAEAITSPDLKITPAMRDAMFDSEHGPQIGQHFIKNPELAEKIAAMPPARQIREIVALEATLKAAAAKQTTKAPPPVTDVKGGGTVERNIAEVEDMDEYAARRKLL